MNAPPQNEIISNQRAARNRSFMFAEMAEGRIYEVEKILGKTENKGKVLYKIKWKGFPSPEFDTWEPHTNLGDCRTMMKEFSGNVKENDSLKTARENVTARKMAQGLLKKSRQLKSKSDTAKKAKKIESENKPKYANKKLPKTSPGANNSNNNVRALKIKIASHVLTQNAKSGISGQFVQAVKSDEKFIAKKKTISAKDKPKKLKIDKIQDGSKLIQVSGIGRLKVQNIGRITAIKAMNSGSGSDSTDSEVTFKLGKKGVKRKLGKQYPDTDSDFESDNDILYSLNDVVIDETGDDGKVSTYNHVKPKEKGVKDSKKAKSTVDGSKLKGVDMDLCKLKKGLTLIDSMKKNKLPTTAKASQPLSVLPFYTSVKPLPSSQSRPPMPTSSLLMDKYYGDLSTFSIPPSIMPVSPSSISYKALLDNLPAQLHPTGGKASSRRGAEEGEGDERVERRISVRTTEYAFRYKQIVVKKCNGYTQIWLNTQTSLKNAINPQVVQEIVAALNSAKYDDSNLVMLSSIGKVFCSGIDLHFLLAGERRAQARQMVDAVRDLIKTFITFPKPIVAAVPGPAIGLGMAILPLCDVIYASDKALFYLPYSQLSQTPEGCISFTLPLAVGLAVSNELLFAGRKITAMEAYQLGLVSQVFWPTSVMQEVIPRVQHMATYSAKAMEATKLLIRSHHRSKLELTNETECNLLLERWSTMECHQAIEAYLSNEKNFLL